MYEKARCKKRCRMYGLPAVCQCLLGSVLGCIVAVSKVADAVEDQVRIQFLNIVLISLVLAVALDYDFTAHFIIDLLPLVRLSTLPIFTTDRSSSGDG